MANKKQTDGEVSVSHDPTTGEFYVGYSSGTERHKHAIAKWQGGTQEEAELTQFYDAAGVPLSNIHNRVPRRERPTPSGSYEEIDIP